MTRALPVLAAIAVVVSSGVAQGVWTHRWTASRDLKAAVGRLDQVPMKFGDWEGQDQEVDSRQLEQAEIAGHITRSYKNRRDGSVVSVLLVCGRPGPIAVHTPDVCYSGAGYALEAAPVREVVRTRGLDPPAEFWRGDFRKQNSLHPSGLRIFWSWAAAGAWKASDFPRLSFARYSALYKLYVIRGTTGAENQTPSHDPSVEFLQVLLPELEKALSPSP